MRNSGRRYMGGGRTPGGHPSAARLRSVKKLGSRPARGAVLKSYTSPRELRTATCPTGWGGSELTLEDSLELGPFSGSEHHWIAHLRHAHELGGLKDRVLRRRGLRKKASIDHQIDSDKEATRV